MSTENLDEKVSSETVEKDEASPSSVGTPADVNKKASSSQEKLDTSDLASVSTKSADHDNIPTSGSEEPSPEHHQSTDESVAFLPPADNKCVIIAPLKAKTGSVASLGRLSPHLSLPQEEPPDGGIRAWSVMIAAFLVNGLLFGTINSSGIIFAKLVEGMEKQEVENPASKASLCLSLTIGMTFLMSLLSGVLTDKFGIRVTTFVGGAIATVGMALSSLVYDQIELLTLTFGFMLGVGGSLAYTPSLVILGHYFRKRLGLVNGIVTAGSSLFTILFPMLFKWVLDDKDDGVMDEGVEGDGLKGNGTMDNGAKDDVEDDRLATLFMVLAVMLSLLMAFAFVFKPRLPPPPPRPAPAHSGTPRSQVVHFLSQVINFEIWKNKKFVIWAVCIPLALFGYFIPYVHLVAYAESVLGPEVPAQTLVQCIGATSGVGRIIFGFVADFPSVDRILLQQISFLCIGSLTMLFTAYHNYYYFVVLSLGMGLFDGCFISLLGPVAFDIVGPSGAPQAIGSLLALCSVPLTFGPVVAGVLKDRLGSYFVPFLVAGLPPILGATAMFSIRLVKAPEIEAKEKEALALTDVEAGKDRDST